MQRRALLRMAAGAGAASAASGLFRPLLFADDAESPAAMRAVARPSVGQIAWQDLEIGMFIHFGPETWQDGRPANEPTPVSEIDPQDLNTDQWARTALGLGAKYIVFVAKHQYGFCWWQTETTDYSIRNTPWKNGHGDVVRDISDSCRRHGLKFGVYVSPRDDHFGAATGGVCKTPERQEEYNRIYREQLTEVFSRYGQLLEIWFDGSTATPVGDLIHKYQPHAMVFQGPEATIRWVGNENGFAPYPCWNGIDKEDAATGTATALNGNPNGTVWMPNEADVSIRRPDWFWKPNNADKVLTEDQILSIYYRSVGRGAQLLLNIPANTEGLLPDKDAGVARRFGTEIQRRFAKAIAETSGSGTSLTLRFANPSVVDTVILQEDTAKGERVRGYVLEGLTGGTWKRLAEGSAIGHKRIQPVTRTTVEAVRLVATRAAALPAIRRLAAFDTGVAPPADWNAPAALWAPNLVGTWHDYHFRIDITKQIQAATQYRLRFVPQTASVNRLKDVVLMLSGVSEPKLVKHLPGRPDELLLDITGTHETSGIVTGMVEGAADGEILIQKL